MAWCWMLNSKALLCFVALAFLATEKATPQVINPSCPDRCGNVSIPYPFGISMGCYLSEDFIVSCDSGTPHLVGSDPPLPIKNISLDSHELIVYTPLVSACYNKSGKVNNTSLMNTLTSQKFPFSHNRNRFTLVGCDTLGLLFGGESYVTGCISYCANSTFVVGGSCSGTGCCQTTNMTKGLFRYRLSIGSMNKHNTSFQFNPCDHAFLADDSYVFQGASDLKNFGREEVPTVLDWSIRDHSCAEAKASSAYACKGDHATCVDSENGPGYNCHCSPGYEGNPYITDGCEDICNHQTCKSEVIMFTSIVGGVALAVLITGIIVVWRVVRRKRINERRSRYFRQNGGLVLQDSLSRLEDAQNAFKVFTAAEMESATNNFAEDRIVGRGGFGVVYMGYLSDGREAAIKKSKSVDKNEIDQFVNEVVLLSKIQHHNVVGFYGCCLETPEPLLVYEYITNGTLLDHLYAKDENWLLPWETRVKVAVETAGVLGYLHQDHRPQIIHSDIKPHNILLDDNYNAKVSDFGISKLAPQNETELYTMVKGTLGYLDPEFIQSSHLTDKSDVYSFGVVLLELLTGQRVLSFDRPERDRTLVKYFQYSMNDGCLLEILDRRITNKENVEELKVAANIADRCVSVKAEERPSMKEVAMELGSLWIEVKNRCIAQGLDVNRRSGHSVGNAANYCGNTSTSYGDTTDHVLLVHLDGGR